VNFRESNRTRWWICLGLLLAIVAVYVRVARFDFVNYDDPDYVTENNAVKYGLSPGSIAWAFTHFHAGNWHPLTWISHMLDTQFFGLNPGEPHLVNVALHAANTILLFLLLQQLTGALWRSAIVAALFALHPLHVESVAWISERKDVLSTLFGLLSLLAYVKYVRESKDHPPSPGFGAARGPKSKVWYARSLAFFALSLLAKPMLVTLPCVMLLLDFWPMRRMENKGFSAFGKLALEKWPWFALSALSSVITFFAQKAGGAVLSMEHLPLSSRIENAIHGYFAYILKMFWPVRLSVFYPFPPDPSSGLALACAVLIIISTVAFITVKRWPFLLVGWLWFLGTLVPVIGLVQVGAQAMADRYTYIPLIGLFIAIVWGVAELLRPKRATRVIGAIAATAVLIALAIATVSQLQYWRNSIELFTHALAVTKDNAPANNNLGTALAALGQRQEALARYAEAVRIDPNNVHYRINLGTAHLRAGQRDAALEEYQAALRVNPQFAEAYSNIGLLFLAERRLPEAITNMITAVQMDPKNGQLRSNLGNVLYMSGRLDEALAQQLQAVQLDPFNATVRFNAGIALLKAGRTDEAGRQFAAAVRLNPKSAEARFELGRQMFLDRRFAGALENLSEAEKLKPNYAVAQFYESGALAELGRFDEAIVVGNRALASAQATGATNLIPGIREALAAYQSHHTFQSK